MEPREVRRLCGRKRHLTYDQLVQKLSGSAKCDYTVDVTKGDGVDSAWKVSGTIQVLNPNERAR